MNLRDRFNARYEAVTETGCWIWIGAMAGNGYGTIGVDGATHLAHRVSWHLHRGERPRAGLDVCHRCDVRCCVNPNHLFIGTRAVNLQDCSNKKRFWQQRITTSAPYAKLKPEDVVAIRTTLSHLSSRAVAKRFGVGKTVVTNIRSGRLWKHITTTEP